MLTRDRVEKESAPVLSKYGIGLTTWSPLASGILSGKYNNGIPKDSRLDRNEWLRQDLTPSNIARVKKLAGVAETLDCSLSQLAIAWCLKNPNVSTVITGASSVEQIEENMLAVMVKDRISDSVKKEIEKILQ
jgi:aryl-alcohol dehydrogenase-like predicted oxidoreductase